MALTSESLAGVNVDVRCGVLARDGALIERAYPLCDHLREALARAGAEEPTENGVAQLSLWYVDLGIRRSESSALSNWASWLTGFIVPAVSATESAAELRVLDPRGVLLDRQVLSVVRVHFFGWGALPLRFRDTSREDEARMARKFYDFAVNRVFSQSLRSGSRVADGVGR